MTFQHKANLNLKPNPYSLSTTRQKQIITTKYGDVFDGGLKLRGSSHITDPWYGVKKNNLWTWDQKQLEIMLTGRAPWGKDGKKVELHHRAQQPNGPLDEMSNSEHKRMSKVLHDASKSRSDGTNPDEFNKNWEKQRARYWVTRAYNHINRTNF